MLEYRHNTKGLGACCSEIRIVLDGDLIREVEFIGGCHGNHQGLQALVRGRSAAETAALLKGTPCRNGTSCPDQLAKALQAAIARAQAENKP